MDGERSPLRNLRALMVRTAFIMDSKRRNPDNSSLYSRPHRVNQLDRTDTMGLVPLFLRSGYSGLFGAGRLPLFRDRVVHRVSP